MGTFAPRCQVLLLEGTPALLDVKRDLLEAEGYRVSVANEPPDLATITALAPDAEWQVLTMIQLDPELRGLPLILCMAAAERVQEPAMAEHVDRQGVPVLLKPFDLAQLVTIVHEELTVQRLINEALADA